MAEGFGAAIASGAMAGFAVGMVNLVSKIITGTGWVEEGVVIALGIGGGN